MKINLLAPLLLAIVFPASAAPQMCFDQAGKDYNIDPLLLMSISIQESSLIANATNSANRDGTEDVCGMQINSSHYKKLAGFNITRQRLMNDPCICVYTGAWVLAHNFRSYGKNWDSVYFRPEKFFWINSRQKRPLAFSKLTTIAGRELRSDEGIKKPLR